MSIKYGSDGIFTNVFYGDSKYQILSVDERASWVGEVGHPGLARLASHHWSESMSTAAKVKLSRAIPARSRPIMLQANFYGPARHKVILG